MHRIEKITTVSVFDELKCRGLIFQHTDEEQLKSLLNSQKISFYCGFDPTAPSMHIGNLVQLILMRHLQNAGHKPICVVGGATGLIGDPKLSGERVMNDAQTVELWVEKLKIQFEKFLDFDNLNDNCAVIENNYQWTSQINAIDFLRDIGKNFRVGTMLSKDTVASRLNSEEGISFTEFSYQVLQGYDYYYLNQKHNVKLQTGGQDQWGNLTSGLDLIHKLTDDKVHVITTPLITDSNGNKFGKSEGGAIWLDESMCSPYKFYQFWLNVADEEVIKLLKIFTFLSLEEIESYEDEVANNPSAREAQKVLAAEVTEFVHGKDALEQAIRASNALFGKGDFFDLDETTIMSALEGVKISAAKIGDSLSQSFIDTKLVSSFSEYRKGLTQNAFSVNNKKISDLNIKIDDSLLLAGDYIVLRKGKKNIAAIKVNRGA